jgi:signal transduction histidine kinase
VLATASTTSESARLTGRAYASPFDRRHLVAVWTVWAVGCVIVMFLRPDAQTIPYHLGWAGFALAFGLGTWSRRQLVTALAWYTLVTGVALERSWLLGRIGWDETTEIPLMFLLTLLMVWHVRRRQAALAHITKLAERDVKAGLDREQLMQLTSHELRTPLTIARGYVELLQTRAVESADLENQQDLLVVADEIERLSRVSERLVRMIRHQDDTANEMVDIDEVMAQALERWRVVADREWILEPGAGRVLGSPERLRTGLDTLVENAIRYTMVGDTIRLAGSRHLQDVLVGVFDSGTGLTDHQIMAINSGEAEPLSATMDLTATAAPLAETVAESEAESVASEETDGALRGTGLGLSIVRALANARGGTLHASHAPDGGAAMVLSFPQHSPVEVGPFDRLFAPDDLPRQPTPPTGRYAPPMRIAPDVASG